MAYFYDWRPISEAKSYYQYSRMQQIWRGAPPPRLRSQIYNLEVWVTGDVADRVLMSVGDVYLPCRTIPDTNRDVSGIPDL